MAAPPVTLREAAWPSPFPHRALPRGTGRAEPARPQLWCGRGWQGSGSGGLTPRILGLAPCQGQFLWKGLSRNFWGLCVFARLTEELEDDLASRDHHRRLELSVIWACPLWGLASSFISPGTKLWEGLAHKRCQMAGNFMDDSTVVLTSFVWREVHQKDYF